MTVPFYCMFAMLLLVLFTKAPVARAMAQAGRGKYDNRDPRSQQATLTGWGKRALAAHQNTLEAIAIFAPGVFISHFARPDQASTAATLAILAVVSRYVYPVLYIADVHLARSAVWGVGFVCSLWLALLPAL